MGLFVFFLPFKISISNTILAVLTCYSIFDLFYFSGNERKKLDSFSKIVLSFYILEILGLLYTQKDNLPYGFFVLEKHLPFVLIPISFFGFSVDKSERNFILSAFAISCGISCTINISENIFYSLEFHNTPFYDWRFSHDRFSEPIGMQAVYFALYLGLSIFILVDFFTESFNKRKKILVNVLLVFALIFFMICLTLLGARTITIGVFVVMFICSALYLKYYGSFSLLRGVLIFSFTLISIIYFHPILRMRYMDFQFKNYEQSNYGGVMARTKIWGPGIEAIKENIWFGVGTGDDETVLHSKFLQVGFLEGIDSRFNIHSQYLQAFLNYGIIGFVMLLLILFFPLRHFYLNRDMLGFAFSLLFILACLTECFFNKNKGVLFFLIFTFLFLKLDRNGGLDK